MMFDELRATAPTPPSWVANKAIVGNGHVDQVAPLQANGRSPWQRSCEGSKPNTLPISGITLNDNLPDPDVKLWPLAIRVLTILALTIISWALVGVLLILAVAITSWAFLFVPAYFLFAK